MAVRSLIVLLFFGSIVLGADEARYWFTPRVVFSDGFHIGPFSWREVTFNFDVCDCTSVLWSESGVWVIRVVSKVRLSSILPSLDVSTDVSGSCCQRTSGIGWSIVLMIYGLSIAAPQRRSGICSAKVRLGLNTLICNVLVFTLLEPALLCGLLFRGGSRLAELALR